MEGVGIRRHAPVVGRDELTGTAVRVLERLHTGGVALLLTGEAGIGKTRALDHLLDTPVARHLPVRRTAAVELEAALPFATIVRLLGLRPDAPDAHAAELGRRLHDAGDEPPEAVLLQVGEGVVDLLERRSVDAPLAVVVDDLQWADPASLRVIDRVLRELDHLRVLVLLAARPAPRPTELSAVQRTLDATDRAQVLTLEPLDAVSALDLARRLLGAEPGPRLRRAIAATGGNPLYLVELLAVVSATELVEAVDLPDDRLPTSLRDLVVAHLAALPSPTLDVLRVAAVMGPSFDLRHLSLVLERGELHVLADLQAALDAGVLVERDDRLAFTHDLLQEALYDEQPAPVRAARHRAVVTTLRTASVPVFDVVPHLLRADWASIPEAADVLYEAGTAMRARSASVAADLLQGALDVAGHDPDPRWQLDTLTAMLLAGRPERARALLGDLARRSFQSFDQATRDQLVGPWLSTGPVAPFEESWAVLDRLQAAGLSPEGEARLAVRRAWLLWRAGRRDEAARHAAQARERARLVAKPELVAAAELVACRLAEGAGDAADATAHVTRALESARRVGDPATFVDAAITYVLVVGTHPGGRRDAERVIEEAAKVAVRTGSPLLQSLVDVVGGAHDVRWGDWERALSRLDAGLGLVEDYGDLLHPSGIAQVAARAARLHAHQGDLGRATQRLRAARVLVDADARAGLSADEALIVHVADVEVALAQDDAEAARTAARAFQDFARARDVPLYEALYAPLLLEVFLRAGDTTAAAAVVDRATAVVGDDPPAPLAHVVRRVRARLAGDADTLVALIPATDDHGIPWEFSPQVREEAAAAMAASGRRGEAVQLLEQALDLWDDVGARHDVDRVRAVLRELGVQRGRGTATSRPEHGWDALTDAEWRVVELVAQGLVYREIGERLFISRRTVETHVRNLFRKLEVTSRAELAARLMAPDGRRRLDGRRGDA